MVAQCTGCVHCRAQSTAQSDFEQLKTTVVTPRCSVNQFVWYKARVDHIVTFHYERSPAFSLCLSRGGTGMSVYQLRGTSRKLLVSSNATGDLGCFESECKHLSLYFDVDDSYNTFRMVYTYRTQTFNSESSVDLCSCHALFCCVECPQCTEVCQKQCFCTAQFGESAPPPHMQALLVA